MVGAGALQGNAMRLPHRRFLQLAAGAAATWLVLMDKIAHRQEFFALRANEVPQPDWPANMTERAVKDWLRRKPGHAAP
jgi:hypothetical protein